MLILFHNLTVKIGTMRILFWLLGFMLAGACISSCVSEKEKQADIVLNNGEKWEVNPEMKPHIEKGKEILNEFIQEGGSDYKLLAEDLSAQNTALIKSCTMTGESHEALHKWLYPHMDLIRDLGEIKTQKEGEEIVAKLEDSFQSYNDFFE
jgi:hypothetical protein